MTQKRVFKTAKKLTAGPSVYRTWTEWEEGDLFVGRYTGSTENKKFKGQYNYSFEVEYAEFKDRKKEKEVIGKTLTLNQCGMLSKAMDKTSEGTLLQLTYTGKHEIQNGPMAGKESHTMEIVEVEEESSDDTGL